MPSNKIKLTLLMILAVILFETSCRNNTTKQPVEETPLYQSAEFMDFYKKFNSDSVYQMEHIVFPLEGIKAPGDTTTVIDPDFRWKQEEWILHKPFDDANGTFVREFNAAGGVVVEKIADNSGTFTMERRFGKLSSGWHLIYYRELGRY